MRTRSGSCFLPNIGLAFSRTRSGSCFLPNIGLLATRHKVHNSQEEECKNGASFVLRDSVCKMKTTSERQPLHLFMFMWCCADADRLGLLNVGLHKRTPLDVTSLKRSNPKLVCSTRAIMVMLKSAFLKME